MNGWQLINHTSFLLSLFEHLIALEENFLERVLAVIVDNFKFLEGLFEGLKIVHFQCQFVSLEIMQRNSSKLLPTKHKAVELLEIYFRNFADELNLHFSDLFLFILFHNFLVNELAFLEFPSIFYFRCN